VVSTQLQKSLNISPSGITMLWMDHDTSITSYSL
jgi:hypothetical protein